MVQGRATRSRYGCGNIFLELKHEDRDESSRNLLMPGILQWCHRHAGTRSKEQHFEISNCRVPPLCKKICTDIKLQVRAHFLFLLFRHCHYTSSEKIAGQRDGDEGEREGLPDKWAFGFVWPRHKHGHSLQYKTWFFGRPLLRKILATQRSYINLFNY